MFHWSGTNSKPLFVNPLSTKQGAKRNIMVSASLLMKSNRYQFSVSFSLKRYVATFQISFIIQFWSFGWNVEIACYIYFHCSFFQNWRERRISQWLPKISRNILQFGYDHPGTTIVCLIKSGKNLQYMTNNSTILVNEHIGPIAISNILDNTIINKPTRSNVVHSLDCR